MPKPLPLLSEPAPERSDAARNREALLDAAVELIERCGVASVTTDAVAEKAGVGKGTVFRRFGSREGLMASVLDHSEREWQAAVIGGPPPLGPGAPPLARLLAFGESRIRTNLLHAHLIEAAGRAAIRNYATISFAAMHVRYLLVELGVQGDHGYLAIALMAPMEFPILRQQVELEGMPVDGVVAAWHDFARRIVEA